MKRRILSACFYAREHEGKDAQGKHHHHHLPHGIVRKGMWKGLTKKREKLRGEEKG